MESLHDGRLGGVSNAGGEKLEQSTFRPITAYAVRGYSIGALT